MRLLSYLYQLKISFINLIYSKTSLITDYVKADPKQELQIELHYNLKQKCEIAAQKKQFINSFTHWPITQAKKNIKPKQMSPLTLGRDHKLSRYIPSISSSTKYTPTKHAVEKKVSMSQSLLNNHTFSVNTTRIKVLPFSCYTFNKTTMNNKLSTIRKLK